MGESENNGSVHKVLGTRTPDGSGGVCSSFNWMAVPNLSRIRTALGRHHRSRGLWARQIGVDASFGDWEQVGMDVGGEDLETQGAFLKINYDFDFATLTSLRLLPI